MTLQEAKELAERIPREDPSCVVLGRRVFHDRHHRPDYLVEVEDTRTERRFILYSVQDWEEQRPGGGGRARPDPRRSL